MQYLSVLAFRGRGSTTKVRCVDVAALFAAAIMRRKPDSVVVPFDTRVIKARTGRFVAEVEAIELVICPRPEQSGRGFSCTPGAARVQRRVGLNEAIDRLKQYVDHVTDGKVLILPHSG